MCKQWKMRGREALSWKDECAGKRARRGSMEGKDRDRRRSRRARLAGRQESDGEQGGPGPHVGEGGVLGERDAGAWGRDGVKSMGGSSDRE